MFRYLRALWYFFTGRFGAAAEALQGNKYVMAATFDAAIDKKGDRIETVKNAVAKMMSLEKQAMDELNELTAKAEKFQRIKQGAGSKAKERALQLQNSGKSKEEILKDPDMLKHQGAYQDASSSYDEVQQSVQKRSSDINAYKSNIATYKVQLQNMQRGLKGLRSEKEEAIAKTQIAQEIESVNSILAGIERDSTDKDLAAARATVKATEARASIASELAGADATLADQEYENYAASFSTKNEFAAMLGLAASTEEETSSENAEKSSRVRIPE